MNKILLLCLLAMSFIAAGADDKSSRELVFKSGFAENTELKGWYDVYKWLPKNRTLETPAAKWYKVVKEGEETFLRTSSIFGISSLLKTAVKIDDSVSEVELLVKLRKPKRDANLISIALTSRKSPSGTNGGAFWQGRQDSGIVAQGYDYSLQHVNLIAWLKDGSRVHMSPVKPPFNLLSQAGKWVTWRLIYKHSEKQLCFYREENEKEPFIVQRDVDLSGITLHSVWLGSSGTEYSQVEVYCSRKQK